MRGTEHRCPKCGADWSCPVACDQGRDKLCLDCLSVPIAAPLADPRDAELGSLRARLAEAERERDELRGLMFSNDAHVAAEATARMRALEAERDAAIADRDRADRWLRGIPRGDDPPHAAVQVLRAVFAACATGATVVGLWRSEATRERAAREKAEADVAALREWLAEWAARWANPATELNPDAGWERGYVAGYREASTSHAAILLARSTKLDGSALLAELTARRARMALLEAVRVAAEVLATPGVYTVAEAAEQWRVLRAALDAAKRT